MADPLQLDPDMSDIAPVDHSPAPGGPPAPAARRARGDAQVKGTSRAKISKGDRRVASRASRISASPPPAPGPRRGPQKPGEKRWGVTGTVARSLAPPRASELPHRGTARHPS